MESNEIVAKVRMNAVKLWQYGWFRKMSYGVVGFTALLTLRKIYDVIYRKYNKLPPGPVGIPLFGSFLSLAANMHQFYYNLSLNYGSISMFYVGQSSIIMIHDNKIIKDLFAKKEFLSLRSERIFSIKTIEDYNNTEWKNRRHLILHSFIGNEHVKSVELADIINDRLSQYLYKNMDKSNNEYYCRNDINFILFNIVHYIVFMDENLEIQPNDAIFTEFRELINKTIELIPLAFIVHWLFGYDSKFGHDLAIKAAPVEQYALSADNIVLNKWILPMMDNRQKINKNSYLYHLLEHLDTADNSKSVDFTLSKQQISRHIQILFRAGISSTSLTIEQGILHAAMHSDQQEMVYKELKDVYKDNQFKLSDVNKTHIFRAFIHELIRLTAVTGGSLPRAMLQDNGYNIKQYHIPKGSIIIGDYYNVNRNDGIWKHGGNNFNLDNFLNDDSKFKSNKNLMTFGYGRRDCDGQALAWKLIRCIMGSLLLQYKFEIIGDKEDFNIVENYRSPNPTELPVRVIKR